MSRLFVPHRAIFTQVFQPITHNLGGYSSGLTHLHARITPLTTQSHLRGTEWTGFRHDSLRVFSESRAEHHQLHAATMEPVLGALHGNEFRTTVERFTDEHRNYILGLSATIQEGQQDVNEVDAALEEAENGNNYPENGDPESCSGHLAEAAFRVVRGLAALCERITRAQHELSHWGDSLPTEAAADQPDPAAMEGSRQHAVRVLEEVSAEHRFSVAVIALRAVAPFYQVAGEFGSGDIGAHYESVRQSLAQLPTLHNLMAFARTETEDFWQHQPGFAGTAGSALSANDRYTILYNRRLEWEGELNEEDRGWWNARKTEAGE
ncbi:hypothetical protein [Krasilnikovia sp. MM14-A1259]|uniref:hypothetical protein n=1 Tax=Krasilnikovia sp. MM14-A1259 TaxID=3373539 RepID=UPI00399D44A2